jgi:hypothetical protein
LFTLSGCDGGGFGDTSGPLVVDCSFAWEGTTTTLRFEDEAADDLSYGDLIVSVSLFDDEYEGRSFSVTAYTEDGVVGNTVLYQMVGDEHPRNEFAGQHGFTGLNWVRDPASMNNLQYACFARSPGEAVRGWED